MIGEKFGKLTILDKIKKYDKSYFICKCDCGNIKEVRIDHLKNNKITSCGCYLIICAKNRKTHGHTIDCNKSPEYNTWRAMKQRCNSLSYHARDRYLNRQICDRWLHSFDNFYADMGDKPTRYHTLERIDNNLGYDMNNCKWVVQKVQNKNKSNNRWYEYNGKNMILSDWAAYFKVSISTISEHLFKKSFEEVVLFYKNKKGILV